jgi:hypothetical protein
LNLSLCPAIISQPPPDLTARYTTAVAMDGWPTLFKIPPETGGRYLQQREREREREREMTGQISGNDEEERSLVGRKTTLPVK